MVPTPARLWVKQHVALGVLWPSYGGCRRGNDGDPSDREQCQQIMSVAGNGIHLPRDCTLEEAIVEGGMELAVGLRVNAIAALA